MVQELLFLLVLFIANAVQGVTGFAGTVLAMPPSILLLGANDAKVVLNMMGWLSCLVLVIEHWRHIDWQELRKIITFMLSGMVIGILLYRLLALDFLLPTYGGLIIVIALKGLLVRKNICISEKFFYVILLAAGVIHGMFISGGALLVVYAAVKLKEKHVFRATVASVWVILNTFLIIIDYMQGLYTEHIIYLSVVSIIPLFLAIYVGNKLHKRINQYRFMQLTYTLLILSGMLVLF